MKPLPGDKPLAPEWVRAWRSDVASPRELGRAYARFRTRRGTMSLAPMAGRWLLAGLLLGFGIAYGATGAPLRVLRSVLPESSDPAARAPERTKRLARGGSPAPALTTPVAAVLAVPSAPPPSAAFAIDPSAAATARRSDPAKGRNGTAAGLVAPLAAPTEAPKASGESAARRADDAWQRAARGLREQNFASANGALLELEAAPQAADRDAARLTRAQLLLATQQHDAARELLAELSANADSPSTRDKARRLLEDSKKSAVDRSGLAPLDTN
jgi:hypothetical protein